MIPLIHQIVAEVDEVEAVEVIAVEATKEDVGIMVTIKVIRTKTTIKA
jgi:hypothetical protein